MAGTQCIYECRHGQDDLLKFKTEHQNGEERWLKWLNVAWLLVADGTVRVFQLLIYWDLVTRQSLGFREEGPKKEKLSSEVRWGQPDSVKLITFVTINLGRRASLTFTLAHQLNISSTLQPIWGMLTIPLCLQYNLLTASCSTITCCVTNPDNFKLVSWTWDDPQDLSPPLGCGRVRVPLWMCSQQID